MIYIISGSIRPDVGKFRSGLRAVSVACDGEPVKVLQVDTPHRWLDGYPHERFNTFVSTLNRCDEDDAILFADGGTGAARTTRYFKKDTIINVGRLAPLVMGFSDASVYTLMAWLWGYTKCYYGPNVVDFRAMCAADLEDISCVFQAATPWANHTFIDAESVNGGGKQRPDRYQIIPVCSRALIQSDLSVQRALGSRISETPTVLMLDDNYPKDSTGTLALYEDLTSLVDIVGPLSANQGILTVGSVPEARGVLSDFKSLAPDLQMIAGVDFAHAANPLIMPYGAEAEVNYDPDVGLRLSLE